MKRIVVGCIAAWAALSSPSAQDTPPPVINELAEKTVSGLPAGPLFWRIESIELHCVTLAQVRAAVGPQTLVAESAGRFWLFTLGPAGGSLAGTTKVAEIGPISPTVAPHLVRIVEAVGSVGTRDFPSLVADLSPSSRGHVGQPRASLRLLGQHFDEE